MKTKPQSSSFKCSLYSVFTLITSIIAVYFLILLGLLMKKYSSLGGDHNTVASSPKPKDHTMFTPSSLPMQPSTSSMSSDHKAEGVHSYLELMKSSQPRHPKPPYIDPVISRPHLVPNNSLTTEL